MRPLPSDDGNTHNGPKLLPLKKRLSKTQQFKRRQKIMAKGSRMDRLELSLGQTQQAMMGAFGVTNKRASRHRKIHYTLHAASLTALGYALAKLLGYL